MYTLTNPFPRHSTLGDLWQRAALRDLMARLFKPRSLNRG